MNQRFENFTVYILRINKLIKKIKLLEMEEYGLKSVHVMCVYFSARENGTLTASELVQLTSEDKGAVSRALAYLMQKGYVNYDSKKYNAPITLTEEGKKLAEIIDARAESAVNAGGNSLTDSDRQSLYRSLKTIADNLEEYSHTFNKE